MSTNNNNQDGRVSNLNDAEIHQFSKGWNVDLDNHIEQPTGYSDAWNGRLYSSDGTLAFVSVNGTRLVYNNQNIIKYNGHYAFEDELIVFAKGNIPAYQVDLINQEIIEIIVNDFEVNSNTNVINGINFSGNYQQNTITIQVPLQDVNEADFIQNLTNEENQQTIDLTYNGLFKTLIYMPSNPTVCLIENVVPLNNLNNINDVIFSFKYDLNNNLVSKILYSGKLNIPLDAVITTEGVSENIYFKRVVFSDYYNPTRTVNIKDPNLFKQSPAEFDIKTKGTLLNPRINSIKKNGQLKAMTVFYVIRLYTENGQSTDFSPLSRGVKITIDNQGVSSGGKVQEITNKSVVVDCFIPDFKNFKTVELIAIEFEGKDVPTGIKLIGLKPTMPIVSFEHFGSEGEFKANITLSDLFANSLGWRYNSDFTVKNNKLLVSGLRNDPLFLNSKELELDFSLSGFDENGETHNSLLNSDPLRYNLINNNYQESFFYTQKKIYNKIEVFGNFKVTLINKITGIGYDFTIPNIIYSYVDRTEEISIFLLQTKLNPNFSNNFPNLNIRKVGNKILFEPINPSIITEFKNYTLVFTTSQVIIDISYDTEKKNLPWPQTMIEKDNALVYGAVSNGWFNGNGIKVTMHSVTEPVLEKNTNWMAGSDLPLKIKNFNLRKSVMKGEIYRLSVQFFKNGNRLFTTLLGDLKIPDIGQYKRELNVDGNVVFSNNRYQNWSVVQNEMIAEKIELRFDVRINCQLSNEVDSYQIVYVERTEENRTILAQGISAPLERMSDGEGGSDNALNFEETMVEKWMLPSTGGPVYDYQGLLNYDENPNMNNKTDKLKTIVTSRKSFYFDSPEFTYNKISANLVQSCNLEYIETIATDHDRHNILGGYNKVTAGFGIGGNKDPDDSGNPGSIAYSKNGTSSIFGPYPFESPKFSQKIPSNLLSGEEKTKPFFVNVSVFANRLKLRNNLSTYASGILADDVFTIDTAEELEEGQIISGFKMNDQFDYANHALSLAHPAWFYGLEARRRPNAEQTTFRVNNIAGGRKTVFIKTKENFFNGENISQTPYIINSKVNFGDRFYRNNDSLKGHDAYIVSNLKRNNVNSIYGGRTELAYASNEYIPLSDVIPVITSRIASQIFYVEGDSYCSLYVKSKTCYTNTIKPELIGFHWADNVTANKRAWQYTKYNAWCYAVVLESTIEPKLNNSEEFYLFSNGIGFDYPETYNEAYFQENNLRKSIPKPFNFKDDPILNNIIAVSNQKLNGDTIDAWTQFLTNEFYELDKNKGTAFNIVKHQDKIYVIQEHQTSEIQIDENSFITPDEGGSAIQVRQGDGTSISGHRIISSFGTSFRRAVIENDFGFIFYDERKFEIVKIIEPLILKNNLSFEIRKLFEADIVVGIQNYYDEKFKESNIQFKTVSGAVFVISYNEVLKVFNGKIEYDYDLYFMFQQKVLFPYNNSKKIGELNSGAQLNFAENQKNLRLKIISAPLFYETKINKGIAVYLNTSYPLLKTIFITSLNQIRTVLGTHHWYKIREGVHTLPSKNPEDSDDIRGEWCSIEIESQSISNKEVKVFSIINFFRKSYK